MESMRCSSQPPKMKTLTAHTLPTGRSFTEWSIKKRGEPPVLIANGMEVEEAAKGGVKTYSMEDFGYSEIAREHKNDTEGFAVAYFRSIFDKLGVRGKLAFYGVADVHSTYHLITLLLNGLSDIIELAPPGKLYQPVPARVHNALFDVAFETKGHDEMEQLRHAARESSAVMRATRDWIGSHRAQDGVVVKEDGSPLTIGDVKAYVRQRLFEHGLEDPEGMIFAQGRDAGLPHSRGTDSDAMRLGETIVFDLFPRLPQGYFHDMTRTWSIGYATPEAQAAYNDVMEAFDRSLEACKVGIPTNHVQKMVCEFFEAKGHKTVLNTPGTTEGYVHSLAHGLGLNVHEAPYFPTITEKYHLQAGSVFTIEPGLYYPEKGYGIRVEDTVCLNEKGELETLTDCPYDLVIPLKEE